MMYTLDIEHGAEVELKHDLKCMLHGKLICFEFKTSSFDPPCSFILPYHYDNLVAFLFDISITHAIDHAFRFTQVCKGRVYLSAYEFYLVASTNHQTNITPEFMTAIAKFQEALKNENHNG